MADMIMLLGKTSSGKTTSLRNLPSASTVVLTSTAKRLSISGLQRVYCKDTPTILNWIKQCAVNPKVKYLVLDDLMFDSVDALFTKIKEKGFDKWTELAFNIYIVIKAIEAIDRDDLVVVVVQHMDVDPTTYQKQIKCVSKVVREQCPIEGYFNVVVEAYREAGEYLFKLKGEDDTDLAKSPLGMFDDFTMDNDMMKVIEGYKKFYGMK